MLRIVGLLIILCVATTAVARRPTLLPNSTKTVSYGQLAPVVNGESTLVSPHVLRLTGTPAQRGYAHGQLLATQIVDFVYFFMIQSYFANDTSSYEQFCKFTQTNFKAPQVYVTEIEGIMQGMQETTTEMYLPMLQRNFSSLDLYAMNAYLEGHGAMSPGPFDGKRHMGKEDDDEEPGACTQSVVFDSMSADGTLMHGRNMDGETDYWKVTNSHLLLIAVAADDVHDGGNTAYSFVNVAWPGFVGTLSAMNENGCVVQVNCGTTGPGKVASELTAVTYVMRQALATQSLSAWQDPSIMQSYFESTFACSEGGVSGQGSELVMSNTKSGYVYECDRYGGVMRTPTNFGTTASAISASNHNHLYGVTGGDDSENWDIKVGFSSMWRYQAAYATLESRSRTLGVNGGLTLSDMKLNQQRPAHGSTEHSIVFVPSAMQIHLAVASMHSDSWDAPYEEWYVFNYEDLFNQQ